MIDIGTKVKILDIGCSRDGMEGIIDVYYPAGFLDKEAVYKVKFSENQFGQFMESQFIIM